MIEAGDDAQQCGLAAPGPADDGDDFALTDAKIDAFQCGDVVGIGLADAADLQHDGYGLSAKLSCQRSSGAAPATIKASVSLPTMAKTMIALKI